MGFLYTPLLILPTHLFRYPQQKKFVEKAGEKEKGGKHQERKGKTQSNLKTSLNHLARARTPPPPPVQLNAIQKRDDAKVYARDTPPNLFTLPLHHARPTYRLRDNGGRGKRWACITVPPIVSWPYW